MDIYEAMEARIDGDVQRTAAEGEADPRTSVHQQSVPGPWDLPQQHPPQETHHAALQQVPLQQYDQCHALSQRCPACVEAPPGSFRLYNLSARPGYAKLVPRTVQCAHCAFGSDEVTHNEYTLQEHR